MYSSSGILMPNIVWGWDLPVLPQLFSDYKGRRFPHGVSSSTLNKRRSSAPHSSSSFSISQWVSAVHFSHWHTKILSLLLERFGRNALFSHVHVYIIWHPDPIFLECCLFWASFCWSPFTGTSGSVQLQRWSECPHCSLQLLLGHWKLLCPG